MKYNISNNGYYGDFGGAYIPEMLYPNVEELRQNYLKIMAEPSFKEEFNQLLKDYVGRPSPLYFARRLSKKYNTKIYLKREGINFIDSISNGFIYMVSSASVTGSSSGFGDEQTNYFKRIKNMKLKNPQIVGFGINSNETFNQATLSAKGAIIGSAFIKHLSKKGVNTIHEFVSGILR